MANPVNFTAQDVQYCIKILQETVDKGVKTVDPAFIEILSNDIETLKASSTSNSMITKLHNSLQHAASQIYDLIEAHLFTKGTNNSFFSDVDPDTIRPLVSEQKPLSDLIAKYKSPTDIKRGLEKLEKHYDIASIAGDGHCLFRYAWRRCFSDYLSSRWG